MLQQMMVEPFALSRLTSLRRFAAETESLVVSRVYSTTVQYGLTALSGEWKAVWWYSTVCEEQKDAKYMAMQSLAAAYRNWSEASGWWQAALNEAKALQLVGPFLVFVQEAVERTATHATQTWETLLAFCAAYDLPIPDFEDGEEDEVPDACCD